MPKNTKTKQKVEVTKKQWAEGLERILTEMDFYFGDRERTLLMMLRPFVQRQMCIGGEYNSIELINIWYKWAKAEREKAEKEGTTEGLRKSLGVWDDSTVESFVQELQGATTA